MKGGWKEERIMDNEREGILCVVRRGGQCMKDFGMVDLEWTKEAV